MSRLILGFAGKIGSGKTTAAMELFAHGWARTRFADTLKHMMVTLGLNAAQIDGDQKEVPCDLLCGKTPRWAMQTIGTEWGRDLIGEDLWVNAWKARVAKIPITQNVVVDDCRFTNEAKSIRAIGGYVILIKRSPLQSAVYNPSSHTLVGTHASEFLAFESDYHIDNDGDKDLFIDNVHQLVLGLRALDGNLGK